jgi:hypothetical protein
MAYRTSSTTGYIGGSSIMSFPFDAEALLYDAGVLVFGLSFNRLSFMWTQVKISIGACITARYE